jgi:hypothetical protein
MMVRFQNGPLHGLEFKVSDAASEVFVRGIPVIWFEGDETADGKSWHCYRSYCLLNSAGVDSGTGFRYIGTVTRSTAGNE